MDSRTKTILFVEDNPLVLNIYRTWLRRDGFQVESAADGLAAQEKLPHVNPGLVILDLMLPGLNGIAVLKLIRQHPDFNATPVLILSNLYLDGSEAKAVLAHSDKHMLKTECTPAKLIAAVRQLLGISGGAQDRLMKDSMLPSEDETLLKEALNSLPENGAKEVLRLREFCLAFVKTAGSPACAEHLAKFFEQVRYLAARIGWGGAIWEWRIWSAPWKPCFLKYRLENRCRRCRCCRP